MSALAQIAQSLYPHLHRHKAIIHKDLFGEEIGAYRRFVARAEFLVDLDMCETGLSKVSRNAIEGKHCARVHIGSLSWSCRPRCHRG